MFGESPRRPCRCAYSRIELLRDPRHFSCPQRTQRTQRKRKRFPLFFASFASFADKLLFRSMSYRMFGESPGRPWPVRLFARRTGGHEATRARGHARAGSVRRSAFACPRALLPSCPPNLPFLNQCLATCLVRAGAGNSCHSAGTNTNNPHQAIGVGGKQA